MRRISLLPIVCFFSACSLLLFALPTQANAQDETLETIETDFTAFESRIETRENAFGLQVPIMVGRLRNNTAVAFQNVTVFADLYDADDNPIGEGFGYIVDACGVALIDAPIQPGQVLRFSLDIELFEPDVQVARWSIYGEGQAIEPETDAALLGMTGVTRISADEVVAVEWVDETTLRYGVGCQRSAFTTYDWFELDVASGRSVRLRANPNASAITDAMIRVTGITQVTQTRATDPTLFDRAFLTFSPQTDRIVYQTDINTLITASPDGSFRRTVHTLLHSYNLQGFVWSPLGNFLAYYFGAYGEPVRYITASSSGRLISNVITASTPSVIVPGISDDGTRAIIGGTFNDVTGYYWKSTQTGANELLFEAELPGNNYPAPAYYRQDNQTRYIYVVRDVDAQATLQCFYREGDDLHTLTPLPLQLTPGERAWTWLSPAANILALAANGLHGGLWLIDLNAWDVCR